MQPALLRWRDHRGLAAVLWIDSQVDHTTGLLTLRASLPLDHLVYRTGSRRPYALVSSFPMLETLNGGLRWQEIALADGAGRSFVIPCAPNSETGRYSNC